MNSERKKRLRSIKVIASEGLMVVAVIFMVVILALLVSGYWINSEGGVDRNGLLQISSIPTGATVTIDGVPSNWLERTNTSKNLHSGEHTISLSRDGYDTWTKTINISEGLLYRIHYPRLFLAERTKENLLDVSKYNKISISPDHSYMILMNDTTEWSAVNLNNETLTPTPVAVGDLFIATANASATAKAETAKAEAATKNQPNSQSAADQAGKVVFNGEIVDINWDRDSSHALLEAKFGDSTEWLLLDVKNPKNSVNITRQYGVNFSEVRILDNSSNNLLVVQNGNLHKIDLGAKSISSILVENVVNFDHYNQNEIVFSAKIANPIEGTPAYYVGQFKIGDKQTKTLEETTTPAKVTLSKFYEDKMITILEGDRLEIYKQDNFQPLVDFTLTFSPDNLVVGHNGEFQTMQAGNRIATLDMESMSVSEWEFEGNDCDWIDNDMLYSVKDGELIVYDYDGLNRRSIANNVSSRFPAAITDDKWLYYFSDGHLVREWLIQR